MRENAAQWFKVYDGISLKWFISVDSSKTGLHRLRHSLNDYQIGKHQFTLYILFFKKRFYKRLCWNSSVLLSLQHGQIQIVLLDMDWIILLPQQVLQNPDFGPSLCEGGLGSGKTFHGQCLKALFLNVNFCKWKRFVFTKFLVGSWLTAPNFPYKEIWKFVFTL